MKRLLCTFFAVVLLLSATAIPENVIEVDRIHAVAAGTDNSADLSSEGEDAEIAPAAIEPSFVEITFEEGFSVSVPADWKYYDITDDMRASGVRYAFSSEDGAFTCYIQLWDTDCADIEALNTIILNTTSPISSGIHDFNGTPFVIYDLPEDDVSCAAALLDDLAVNIVFAPQSDSGFMLTCAKIMQSFRIK